VDPTTALVREGETVIAEIDGKRLQTRRNLHEEKQLANAVIAACPTLTRTEEQDGEWLIEQPEDCLELLLELQALGDTVVRHGWKEKNCGQAPRDSKISAVNSTPARLVCCHWRVETDKDLVLDMQQLLQNYWIKPQVSYSACDGQPGFNQHCKRLDELQGVWKT